MKLRRSRFYIFNNELETWYYTNSGSWRVEKSNALYPSNKNPWGLETNDEIEDRINWLLRGKLDWSYLCLTKKEFEEHKFLDNL